MQSTTYTIAEQVGEFGIYGKVELRCEITKDFGKLNVRCSSEFARWQPGILFGATYFLEHSMKSIGLELEIVNIEFNDVDTNNTVIAYVVFQALVEVNMVPIRRKIIFDREQKSFVFPK